MTTKYPKNVSYFYNISKPPVKGIEFIPDCDPIGIKDVQPGNIVLDKNKCYGNIEPRDKPEYFLSCLETLISITTFNILIFKKEDFALTNKKFSIYEETIDQFATDNPNLKIAVYSSKLKPFIFTIQEYTLTNNDFDTDEIKGDEYARFKLTDYLKTMIQKNKFSKMTSDFLKIGVGKLQKITEVLQKVGKEKSDEIYPPLPQVFNSFLFCPFEKCKVVIIGQDPYPGAGEAMGLSFSVPEGVKIPSSLKNIYKECESDGFKQDWTSGNLERWAEQGVFLYNATLTVEKGIKNVHQIYWDSFSRECINYISEKKKFVVFILWGSFAKSFESSIDEKHCILKSVHPSGLSANRGFFGSKCFAKCNKELKKKGIEEIKW